MDLCVMIESQEGVTWDQWRALAEACEQHAIPGLFYSDHYLSVIDGDETRPALDAWAITSALAAVTTTLHLGPLVSAATFRHPAVFAKMAATADHISGGRLEPGLGAGWAQREHEAFGFPYGTVRDRFDVFAEQLEIVRGLWGPGPFTFAGAHYRLDAVDALPKPTRDPMSLIVGGTAKRRGAELAARFATEYNTVEATPDMVRERRARVEEAWVTAGRDPASVRFSVMTGLIGGRDAGDVADRRARLAAERAVTDPAPGTLIGTDDEVIPALQALREAGADRVMLRLLLHDDLDQIAWIGDTLAPAVAG